MWRLHFCISMALLAHGRIINCQSSQKTYSFSKREWTVNTSCSPNSTLPRGPSLSTALKTLCMRLIWIAGIMVKFRCSCLDWNGFSWHKYQTPHRWVQSSLFEAPDGRRGTGPRWLVLCSQRWLLPLRSQCLCNVFATEQGYWQGSRARWLSVRLC